MKKKQADFIFFWKLLSSLSSLILPCVQPASCLWAGPICHCPIPPNDHLPSHSDWPFLSPFAGPSPLCPHWRRRMRSLTTPWSVWIRVSGACGIFFASLVLMDLEILSKTAFHTLEFPRIVFLSLKMPVLVRQVGCLCKRTSWFVTSHNLTSAFAEPRR